MPVNVPAPLRIKYPVPVLLKPCVPATAASAASRPRRVARRFNVIAWGAFAVLVVTGIWNVASVHLSDQSDSYKATLAVKIVVVALSGASAFAHARTSNRMLIALGGALGGLTAVVALFLGVLLH